MKNQAAATKEEFALEVLLESIEEGNIGSVQWILKKINDAGLELIVRERKGDSEIH